jgi:hypothetical protein
MSMQGNHELRNTDLRFALVICCPFLPFDERLEDLPGPSLFFIKTQKGKAVPFVVVEVKV